MNDYAADREEPKTRVFISYSRNDSTFVDALVEALRTRGYECLVDRADIAPGEDWRVRLDTLILAADAVVYVLTDSALASDICAWEVARSVELGKRLIPLAHGPRARAAPEALSALNYVFSDAPKAGAAAPAEPSPAALNDLARALDTDITWVREHARLTARAAEWTKAAEHHKEAKLLRRGEVDSARAWIRLRPGRAAPSVPQGLVAFIDASDAHETRQRDRQRRTVGRSFVKPIEQALQEGRHDAAVRLAIAGSVLADDPGVSLVPEIWRAAARAVFEGNARSLVSEPGASIRSAQFSPDCTKLVAASLQSVRVLDARTSEEILRIKGHSAMFSPDGARLVVAEPENTASVWELVSGAKIARLQGHSDQVLVAAFSPDGVRIVTGSKDGTARIWNASTGEEISQLKGHESYVHLAGFSSDGGRVISASFDNTARVWNANGSEIAVLRGHEGRIGDIRSAMFSPGSTRVVTASRDGTVRVWDAASGAEILRLRSEVDELGLSRWFDSAAFCPDGARILTASRDGTARLWEADSGREIARLRGHLGPVNAATFSLDGARIVTASRDGTARMWDSSDGTEIGRLVHDGAVYAAEFSSDGAHIVSICGQGHQGASMLDGDHVARVWDAAPWPEIVRLRGHENWVRTACFSRDGRHVITASADKTARVWDAANGRELCRLAGHEALVHCALFTRTSLAEQDQRAITVSGRSVRVWNMATCEETARLLGHQNDVLFAASNADGAHIVTASSDATARVWDIATGNEVACMRGHEGWVHSASFSADGERVATAGGDTTARVWDARTGVELVCLRGHDKAVYVAEISADGQKLLTASEDRTARVWDMKTGSEAACFRGHTGQITVAAFCPRGERIITGSWDCTARIWDLVSGREVACLLGHGHQVTSVAFSADGNRVVTSSGDGTARVWDAKTGAELFRLLGHENTVITAAFSPDGARVVTASQDSTARVWDVSATAAIRFGPSVLLAAASASGLGRRTANERDDLLMQDAPEDLHCSLVHAVPGERSELVKAAADALRGLRHPNSYLSPRQFAARFHLTTQEPTESHAQLTTVANLTQETPPLDLATAPLPPQILQQETLPPGPSQKVSARPRKSAEAVSNGAGLLGAILFGLFMFALGAAVVLGLKELGLVSWN